MCAKSLQSCTTLCAPWTVGYQAPLPTGFSRQEYWSGLPHPPPENLPKQGIKPGLLYLPALAGRFFTTSTASEAQCISLLYFTPALGAQNHRSAPTLGSVCPYPKHAHFHHQTEVSLPSGNGTSFLWISFHTSVSIQIG